MALDIRNGDVLTVASKDYAIKFCESWSGMKISNAFRRLASLSATTKRTPAVTANQRGDPATYLTDLNCTPLDPISPDVQARLPFQTAFQLLETYIADSDGFVKLYVEDATRTV